MQCPVTCGGGVRSRTVTCTLAPKKTCDLSTKPRTRSLCALQSCPNSGLRRRPGPPPKYRRINPPKSHPTRHPSTTTWAPMNTTTTAGPTVSITARKKTTTKETTTAFIPTTTSLSTPKTTIPKIIDTDDDEFNVKVKKNNDKRGKGFPSKANSAKKNKKASGVEKEKVEEREEGEDGSTPNVVMYTPGYDYVVEDRTMEEEGIIDLDVTTSTSLKNLLKSTTPTLHTLITTTSQTSPPTMHTTKVPSTTYSTPHTSTKTWAKTTHHYPFTNPHTTHRISAYSHWTNTVALTTPIYKNHSVPSKAGVHTTHAPSTTARKPFTTVASPQSTVKIVKLKKSAVTPKKNSSVSRGKKPSTWSKGSHSESHNHQLENPLSSSTGDQENLMVKQPISMDIFWVVGNWSEVGANIL